MSEVFRGGNAFSREHSGIPVPVLIAGSAIIATRLISVLLLANELGYEEILNVIHRSAQSWDATLIFIASQLIFFLELRCAIAVMRGHNWGRWIFLATQAIVLLYMLIATMTGIYPEIFSIAGENNVRIISTIIAQKFPDIVVLLLLFVPHSSRQFYHQAIPHR